MAYFDSPKNRAMWEKEMTALRSERKIRESGGFAPAAGIQEGAAAAEKTVKRELTNFRELQREESAAVCALQNNKEKVYQNGHILPREERRELQSREAQMA